MATRSGTPQPNASPFQDALALELGLALPGALPQGTDAPAAAETGGSLEPGEDTAQVAVATDASLALALVGWPAMPPAFALLPPPAAPAAAPLPPAFAAPGTEPAGLALNPRQDPFTGTCAAPKTGLELPGASAAADLAVPGKFPRGAAGETARSSAAQKSELQLPLAPDAADFAVPGKFAPPAEGEIRRELAFETNLPDQLKAAPAPSAAMHAGAAIPAQTTQAPAATLEARVGERGWDQGLCDKLVWMAGQKQQVAELQLNPPELGPLKITLKLDHDQASAQFVSAHAAVREAIETAMPRLREMLADSGITLGNTSVSTDAFHEQAQPRHEPRAYPAAANPDAVTRGEQSLRRPRGLVDTFA